MPDEAKQPWDYTVSEIKALAAGYDKDMQMLPMFQRKALNQTHPKELAAIEEFAKLAIKGARESWTLALTEEWEKLKSLLVNEGILYEPIKS